MVIPLLANQDLTTMLQCTVINVISGSITLATDPSVSAVLVFVTLICTHFEKYL